MDNAELREAERDALLTLFNRTPADFAWPAPACEHIEARRAQMHGQLIFDVLLATGGVRPAAALFPPRDDEALAGLLDAVLDSTYDTLKKDCLIYYLIKFHGDGREEVFGDERSIPPQFMLLADAYWHLDNGADVPKAVSILSDVRLNRDYTSKIFQAISLADEPNPLILKYVRTAKPLLTEPVDIDMFTVALAESSLLDAWRYQRTFSEGTEMRARLVHKILEWCLTPRPRAEPLTLLLGFPFSKYEEDLIHEYALHPPSTLPPSALPVIQDLICVRLIQSGKYAAAIKLDRRFAAAALPDATPAMEAAVQARRAMADELLATLPAVERDMLQAEMEAEASGGRSAAFFDKMQDLSVSWEEVPGPAAAVSISAPPPRPAPSKDTSIYGASTSISARNDLPRFGASVSVNGNGNAFTPKSTSAVSQQKTNHLMPQLSHSASLSSLQGSRMPAPLLGSSGIKYPTPLFGHPTPSLSARVPATASKPTSSLFTMGGSANQTRNAFYTPPTTNGVKRPLGDDDDKRAGAPNPADAPPVSVPVPDADVSMDTDDEHASEPDRATPPAPAELSYSVFGGGPSPAKQPPLKTRRVVKTEAEEGPGPAQKATMPPGAFHMDEDDLPTPTRTAEPTPSRSRTVSPAPPPPPTRAAGERKSGARRGRQDLSRSVPGAFGDEEEEEDHVAPLPASPPPSKRPARKPRASRSVASEEDDAPRATRRSTRLSSVASVASASPEPSPPKKAPAKGRKSTRTSSKK